MDRRAVNHKYICNMLQSDTIWCVLAFIVDYDQALLISRLDIPVVYKL